MLLKVLLTLRSFKAIYTTTLTSLPELSELSELSESELLLLPLPEELLLCSSTGMSAGSNSVCDLSEISVLDINFWEAVWKKQTFIEVTTS